ncbi:MAG: hypothetical protein ACI8Z9_000577 [Paraglaciecola sp.]|jgi:hypothetical protein
MHLAEEGVRVKTLRYACHKPEQTLHYQIIAKS